MGISIGAITVLLMVSHISKNMEPVIAENGINILLLLPTNFRVICGIISPTKLITPQQLTIQAVINELKRKRYFTVLDVFTPKEFDFSFPKLIIFITFPKQHKIITQIITNIVTTYNSLSSKKERFPISHINAEYSLSEDDIEKTNITAEEKI